MIRQLVGPAGEQYEGRRPGLGLRHVFRLHALAAHRRRRMPRRGHRQPVVEVAGLDLGRPVAVRLEHRRHQAIQPSPGLGRQGDDLRALDLRQEAVGLFDELGQLGRLVLDQVPFGQHEHQRPPLALHQVGDLQVLDLQRVGGVHHQDHHLSVGDRTDGIVGRQLLQLGLHLGLAAQTGGVDQPDGPIIPGPVDRDGVAGDPGLRAGQHPVLADQAIDQGRFASVRTADDRDGDRFVGCLGFFIVFRQRQGQHGGVEIRHALAMLSRDGDGFAQAQAERLQHTGFRRLTLGLVGRDDHRPALAPQHIGEDQVARRHALPRIDDEQRQIRLIDRQLSLHAHARLQALVGDVLKAGGVDQLQVQIAQPSHAKPPVAGHPRLVIDNRQLLAGQPVEQRGFADVRPPDDCDPERQGPGLLTGSRSGRRPG